MEVKKTILALGISTALAVIPGIASPVTVHAAAQAIESDGYYTVADGTQESLITAQRRARSNAKKAIVDKALVSVNKLPETKAGQLSNDELKALLGNILNIQHANIIQESQNGKSARYHCHMIASLDPEIFKAWLHQDKNILHEQIQRNMEIEQKSAQLDAEMLLLSDAYSKTADPKQTEKLQQKVQTNEVEFESNQLILKGMEAENQNDPAGAVYCYQKAIDINSKNGDAYDALGAVFSRLNEPKKAIEIYEKLKDIDNENPKAYNNLGVCFEKAGDYDKAVSSYNKALSMDWSRLGNSKKAHVYKNLGWSYERMGKNTKAIDQFKKALELSPDFADAYAGLGYCYLEANDPNSAISYLHKAITLNNRDLYSFINLGDALNALGSYSNAINAFSKALELDNTDADAYGGLGQAYEKSGDLDKAIACYTRITDISGNDKDLYCAYLFRGLCQVKQKKYQAALEDLTHALMIDGTDPKLRAFRDKLQKQLIS